MKKMKMDSGFTLVELLVVLIVLGIIATISIVAFGNSRKNSVQSACKTSYQTALLAVQAYQTDNNGQLPASLIDLAPSYINSGLIDTDNFALQLQPLNTGFSILVDKTGNALVRTGILKSTSGSTFTYFVADATGISPQQIVSGSGIGSLISTNATYSSGSDTAIVESSDGISLGSEVVSVDLPPQTIVSAIDINLNKITFNNVFSGAGSSKGLVFGTSPTVDSVDLANGNVTIAGSTSFKTPNLGSKYTLVFGGITIPGTAPLACRSL